MGHIAKKINSNDKSELVKCLRKIKKEIDMNEVRAYLNEEGIDYSNWTDMDMILYYLTGELPW